MGASGGTGAVNGAAGALNGAAEADGGVEIGASDVSSRGVLRSIGAPNPPSAGDGTKAGVGGRSVGGVVDGIVDGVTDAGVTGVGRRGGANGGMRAAPASRAGAAPNDNAASRAPPSLGRAGAADSVAGGVAGGVVGGTVTVGEAARGATTGGTNGAGAKAAAGDRSVAGGASFGPAGVSVEVLAAPVAVLAPASTLRTIELGKSSAHRTLAPTGINPPQIEQRARRLAPVTLAGSTRYTDWHSGHETFMTRQSH